MIELLLTYKYFILIPLAIIEGPIVAVIVGFLVTLHYFNPVVVYIVMVLGDIVGDGLVYCIGYGGKRFLKYFRVTPEKMEKAKQYFADNHKKAIITSKLVHGIGFVGLIAAGASHVSYRKYFTTCAVISIIQSFLMFILGVLFGHAYVLIGKYLNYYAALVSIGILLVMMIILFRKYKDKIGKKISL